MNIIDKLGGSAVKDLLRNLNEIPNEKLEKYNMYLMQDETIETGFILVRDVVIFTDKRILCFDKQGATGTRMRVVSIYLDSIVGITAETAGFGIDDSQIEIEYISSPYFRASDSIVISSKTFEFPKKFAIQPLYKWLQEIAYVNHLHINA